MKLLIILAALTLAGFISQQDTLSLQDHMIDACNNNAANCQQLINQVQSNPRLEVLSAPNPNGTWRYWIEQH